MDPLHTISFWFVVALNTHAVVPAWQGEVAPGGGGGGTLHGWLTSVRPLSTKPSQLSSTLLQVSGCAVMAPWHCRVPPTHTSTPGTHPPTVDPQGLPSSMRSPISSACPSQSSSKVLHVSSSSPG